MRRVLVDQLLMIANHFIYSLCNNLQFLPARTASSIWHHYLQDGFFSCHLFYLKYFITCCTTVLSFTFLSVFKLWNTTDNLQDGSFCFFSFHLFCLRCRWRKKRIHLSRHAKKRVRLHIPRKDHILVVLHRAFLWF